MHFLKVLYNTVLEAIKGPDFENECDETLYHLHYASTGIPHEVPLRVRKVLIEQLGRRWSSVQPEDDLIEDDELDFFEIMNEIGDEFGISIPEEEMRTIHTSFDSVVRYIAGRVN